MESKRKRKRRVRGRRRNLAALTRGQPGASLDRDPQSGRATTVPVCHLVRTYVGRKVLTGQPLKEGRTEMYNGLRLRPSCKYGFAQKALLSNPEVSFNAIVDHEYDPLESRQAPWSDMSN
ncbi:hypothetical protein BHE74_00040714 [Ensete ventricosum]|nr:hypothetical protein BHE74_00040714 [Ensete ventricosum]RZS18985.1 hypothetical protein BHM03_00051324 [Ensete ventricosum]